MRQEQHNSIAAITAGSPLVTRMLRAKKKPTVTAPAVIGLKCR
jgi:hypothetical protein